MKKTFHHVGVPTTQKRMNEVYLPSMDLGITDASSHPHCIEYVRCGERCTLPDVLRHKSHVAFTVDNLDEAIAGQNVIVPPTEPIPGVRVAFIMDDETPIEFMEMKG